jgi:hypothetical protein
LEPTQTLSDSSQRNSTPRKADGGIDAKALITDLGKTLVTQLAVLGETLGKRDSSATPSGKSDKNKTPAKRQKKD